MNAFASIRIIFFILIINSICNNASYAQLNAIRNNNDLFLLSSNKKTDLTKKQIQQLKLFEKRFQSFGELTNSAVYTITLCGDLPDNDHPERVHVKQEPGHVFIIFEKKDSFSTCSFAFGFYPLNPFASLVFKNVRSKILENYSREYEVSISKTLTPGAFQLLLQKAKELSSKKYDLRKYNCYDFALEVFNSIPNIEKLPLSKTKFPFIFGRGGSPCCLYKDLKTLKEQNGFWKDAIQIGHFKSAVACKD